MPYFNGIEWVGFNYIPDCRAWVRKRFPDYHVLDYAHRGELDLRLDDGPRIRLKAPVAWITFPGPFFDFHPDPGAEWNHRHIGFRGPRVESWKRSGLLSYATRRPVFPVRDPDRFAGAMDEILNELGSPVYGPARATQMFEGLLLQLHEQRVPHPPRSPAESRVSDLIVAIKREPETDRSWEDTARELGLSHSHFRSIFHRLAGQPPHQFMIRQRMEKAARLLRKSPMEIKEIAQRIGYDDIFHFTKLFTHHFRTPPGRFRARAILK